MTSPFFILGNPRSGTTLLRLMLNSHPMVVVPPESGFLQWWYEKYKNIKIEELSNNDFVIKFIKDVLSSKKIETWGLNFDDLVLMTHKKTPESYGKFCLLVYELYGIKHNKINPVIGDKNNYYIHHLKTIKDIYPNAKYIHLIRDGRDVACSYINVNKLTTDSLYKPILPNKIEDIAKEWKDNTKRIEEFIIKEDSIKIKYEDLILNPVVILKEITGFLGIEYSSLMLNYHLDTNNDEPKSTIDWKLKTKQQIDSSNLNKYKLILTEKQVNTFNRITVNELKNNGYWP